MRRDNGTATNLMKPGNWFVDIGGGYGRLMNLYKDIYSNIVILDHSISMLEDVNNFLLQNRIENIKLVVANVYSLPFVNDVFDSGIMIRVIHHLEYPELVLQEINRVLVNNGSFVLEYQNKNHIGGRIKSIFNNRMRKEFSLLKPYKIRDLYWNYHPEFIRDKCKDLFEIKDELGGGIFWNRKLLTTIIPHAEYIDSFLSHFFGKHHITHQIFLKLMTLKNVQEVTNTGLRNIEDMFRCVVCESMALEKQNNKLVCTMCKREYAIRDNIYDFRIEANK